MKLGIMDCVPVTLQKAHSFGNVLFGSLEISEHPFLSEHFQKSICN